MPVRGVFVDHGVLEALFVVVDWHEEGAVVGLNHASFLLELIGPLFVFIIPWASVPFR